MGNIWAAHNGGDWNNDPSADPATGVGGYAIAPFELGNPVYAAMMGDVSIIEANLGASPFTYSVPSGFISGWPAVPSGFTTIDPSKTSGDITLSSGNLTGAMNPSLGLGLSVDGYGSGKFYWEYQISGLDIFTHAGGMGIIPNGGSFPGDGEGWVNGAGVNLDSIYVNNTQYSGLFTGISDGDTMRIAIQFESEGIVGVAGIGHAGTISVNSIAGAILTLRELTGVSPYLDSGIAYVSLRWSDDGGNTWGSPLILPLGATGAFYTSLLWQQLGYSRDRVFEISHAANGQTALQGVFLTYSKAGS